MQGETSQSRPKISKKKSEFYAPKREQRGSLSNAHNVLKVSFVRGDFFKVIFSQKFCYIYMVNFFDLPNTPQITLEWSVWITYVCLLHQRRLVKDHFDLKQLSTDGASVPGFTV